MALTSPAARIRADQRSSPAVSPSATPRSIARPTSAGTTARAAIHTTPYTIPRASVPSCPRATHTRKRVGERRSGVPGWPSGSSRILRPYRRRPQVKTEIRAGARARTSGEAGRVARPRPVPYGSAGVDGQPLLDLGDLPVGDGQGVVVGALLAGVGGQHGEQVVAGAVLLAGVPQLHDHAAGQGQGAQPRVLVADPGGEVL